MNAAFCCLERKPMSWITRLFGAVVSFFKKPPTKPPPPPPTHSPPPPAMAECKQENAVVKTTTTKGKTMAATATAVAKPAIAIQKASDIEALAELVQREGFPLKKQGRSFGGPICPVCGEAEHKSSNRLSVFEGKDKPRWKCHACGATGDWPEFLCKARGIHIGEALKIAGQQQPQLRTAAGAAVKKPPAKEEEQSSEALLKVIQRLRALAFKTPPDAEMSRFLYEKRMLSARSVEVLTTNLDAVRFLPSDPYQCLKFLIEKVGEELLVESGIWKKGSKWPAIAFRPFVTFYGDNSVDFRQIREPENPEYSNKSIRYGVMKFPVVWKRSAVVKRFFVTEGIFDMMASAELGYVLPEDAVMAIPGTETWKEAWLQMVGKKYPDIEVVGAMDADKSGDAAAEKMGKYCASIGISFQRLRPNHPDCKDWNEILIAKRRKSQHKIAA